MPGAETSHAHRVLSSLNQQRAAGRFCDAVLNLGDGVLYQAHCNVLACFSDLFEVSISNPTQHTEFDLQGCPSDGLELLLTFVYSGELKLEVDNLQKVQQAATSLCVPEALALCQQFQVNSGNPTSEGVVENVKSDQPAAESEVQYIHIHMILKWEEKDTFFAQKTFLKLAFHLYFSLFTASDLYPGSDSQEADETAAEVEEAGDDDGGELEGIVDDTDEEYLPPAESGSATSPASTAQKRKLQSKTNNSKNNDGVEECSNKGSAQCPVCLKSFKSKYYLKVHNRYKVNMIIFQGFLSREYPLTFVSCRRHTGEKPFCSTCNEQFMYKKNLTMHLMKVHGHPKPHACPQCPKTFLTRTELRVHEAAKHRGEKPFVCEECGHRASSRNGLQMHIKAIHRNERPFVCNICGHAFSQKNNLSMHLRVHSGERPYQCHLCGKTFRTQASLDKHHRTHTGERPYGCDVCDWRFTEKGALLRHKASKHEEGRPHCCYMCNKTFKALQQLRVHLQRHRGMRKFECTDCGYKFTRQAHLRRHVQIHKRTENYNPRQRKLRNLIVQEVDGNPEESEATRSTAAHVTECSPGPAASQQAANNNSSPEKKSLICASLLVFHPFIKAYKQLSYLKLKVAYHYAEKSKNKKISTN
uniref:Zinc finger and BTB domain containing 48 n=1 Tax=Xiphophorus couchianus TaxID=32473 RepID=A0A3B5MM75_9TELE